MYTHVHAYTHVVNYTHVNSCTSTGAHFVFTQREKT